MTSYHFKHHLWLIKGGYYKAAEWELHPGSLRVPLPFTKQICSPKHLSLVHLNQHNFSSLILLLQFVSNEQVRFLVFLTITLLQAAILLCAITPKFLVGILSEQFYFHSPLVHNSFLSAFCPFYSKKSFCFQMLTCPNNNCS